MIDTLHFRLHDLSIHRDLVAQVRGFKSYRAAYSATFNDMENLRYLRDKPMFYFSDKLRNVVYEPHEKMGHFTVPSFTYKPTFKVDLELDFIEFNFSVPKYVYGTNANEYIKNGTISFEESGSYLYSLLIGSIKKFFADAFLLDIDLAFVELLRFDLCYNQYFLTKDDALLYLDHLKSVKKKGRIAGSSDLMQRYDTSLSYRTKTNFYKIYLKGPEFRKHDAIELLKSPKNSVASVMNAANIADRILRYEISFNYKWMSYIFTRKIFRKSCVIHKDLMFSFKLIKQHYAVHAFNGISYKQKQMYGEYNSLLNSNFRFFLHQPLPPWHHFRTPEYKENIMTDESRQYEPEPAIDKRALFDSLMCRLAVKKFVDFFNEYQIQEVDTIIAFKQKLESALSDGQQLNKEKLFSFYSNLNTFGVEYCRKNFYKKNTFYRLKKIMLSLGIDISNFIEHKIKTDVYKSMLDYNDLIDNKISLNFSKKR